MREINGCAAPGSGTHDGFSLLGSQLHGSQNGGEWGDLHSWKMKTCRFEAIRTEIWFKKIMKYVVDRGSKCSSTNIFFTQVVKEISTYLNNFTGTSSVSKLVFGISIQSHTSHGCSKMLWTKTSSKIIQNVQDFTVNSDDSGSVR